MNGAPSINPYQLFMFYLYQVKDAWFNLQNQMR